jgi:hypothetical protein
MKFFNRILKQAEIDATEEQPSERRGKPRYAISPEFVLRATIKLAPGTAAVPAAGTAAGAADTGWDCQVLDCSEDGLRIQMLPSFRVQARALCHLILSVHAFELVVPCQIANVRHQGAYVIFGLNLAIEDETTWAAYWQFLEVVALGATLKLHRRATEPDASGYVVESWANHRPARLTVWRHPSDGGIAAFEFRLKNYLVRATAGGKVQYLTGTAARPTTPARTEEIQRLFRWVVLNLNATVPADVRTFLTAHTL